MGSVEQDRYVADLEFVAAQRPPGSDHHAAVRALCEERFASLGYDVEAQDYGSGVNVVGRRQGTARPEELVIVSAHYDHVPGCEGADDNGSGVAGVLEAARVLSAGSWDRTLVVACWDEEESGMLGSDAWVRGVASSGDQIVASFVFEMIGYTSQERGSQSVPAGFDQIFPQQVAALDEAGAIGNFITLVGNEAARGGLAVLSDHAAVASLPAIVIEVAADQLAVFEAGDLWRSDHASFWQAGHPAVMITDTAEFRNPNYHCGAGPDTVETLDHGFATKVISMTVAASAELLAAD